VRPIGTAGIAALAALACAAPAGAAVPSGNLLVNGDAQAGAGATDSSAVAPVPIPGWATTANLTEHAYGAGTFPDTAVSAAIGGGTQFFAGGPRATGDNTTETAGQDVDVAGAGAEIDAGGVRATLAAALGGFESQADAARVDATFLAADGRSLGGVTVGPVTAADRGHETRLLARTASAAVPAGTRRVRVVITATRVEGSYNDGYADNVSLSLAAVPAPTPPPTGRPGALRLPAAHGCVRRLRVSARPATGTRIVALRATARGHVVAARRGSRLRAVTLRRLPPGRFRLRVVATQSDGAHLSAVRTYRRCRR
jgi:hypothetical protein